MDSSNLESMFFKVLRRVCLVSWNVGQYRRKWEVDSILEPQLQSGFKQFWKFYLNLCSHKWLNSSRSRVINLISLRLQQLKKLFGLGRRLGSRLFHSMIDDGKKEFLLCLILKRGISAFLVPYDDVFSGINLKTCCGLLLLKIL